MIILKIKNIYRKIIFSDSFWGILINPNYISRAYLFKSIKYFSRKINNGILLDLGCGSKPYKELFSVKKYLGIDLNHSGHDHTSSKIDLFYDGKNIPFKNNYFDYVFSSEVFEHIFNLEQILSEINRVTKKGGNLLITIPFCVQEHEVPYDFARYSYYGIKSILARHGFKIIGHHKTSNNVGTIFQMIAWYISECLLPNNRYLKLCLTPLLISPFTLMGIFLSKLLPSDKKLYLNNVIYCEKINN
jgi:SAM-dependent methyltransferase